MLVAVCVVDRRAGGQAGPASPDRASVTSTAAAAAGLRVYHHHAERPAATAGHAHPATCWRIRPAHQVLDPCVWRWDRTVDWIDRLTIGSNRTISTVVRASCYVIAVTTQDRAGRTNEKD